MGRHIFHSISFKTNFLFHIIPDGIIALIDNSLIVIVPEGQNIYRNNETTNKPKSRMGRHRLIPHPSKYISHQIEC